MSGICKAAGERNHISTAIQLTKPFPTGLNNPDADTGTQGPNDYIHGSGQWESEGGVCIQK